MADPATAAEREGGSSVAREFWSGLTRPSFGAAWAMLGLAALGWLAVIAGSTTAHVRRTPAGQWVRNPLDDYGLLTARCLQGAELLARDAETVVFVGPSLMREALPDEPSLSALFSENRAAPVRALKLCGNSLSVLEAAAVIDTFGSDFRGIFVMSVSRHRLNRGLDLRSAEKVHTDGALGFTSAVWEEELRRANVTPPARVGWDFWDHRAFYVRTMGGWRHAWGAPPPIFPHFFSPGENPSDEKIRAFLPEDNPAARAAVRDAIGRIAERLRRAGGARLVLVEFPWADSAVPSVQDETWRAADQRHRAEMQAWSQANQVPWIDVREAMHLQRSDYCDVLHVVQTEARHRVARAIEAPLRGLLP